MATQDAAIIAASHALHERNESAYPDVVRLVGRDMAKAMLLHHFYTLAHHTPTCCPASTQRGITEWVSARAARAEALLPH
jgi:hypothetical protein